MVSAASSAKRGTDVRSLEPGHAVEVGGRQRLLDQLGAQIGDRRESRCRALAAPALVGVVAERRLRQLAGERLGERQITVEAELDLERGERGGGARLREHLLRRADGDRVRGAHRRPLQAEHAPDRLAGLLAGEVPGGGAQAGPQGRPRRRRRALTRGQTVAQSLHCGRPLQVGDLRGQGDERGHALGTRLAVAAVGRGLAATHVLAGAQLDRVVGELGVRPA